MSVNKVIELMSESSENWEHAAQQAIDKASRLSQGHQVGLGSGLFGDRIR